MAIIRVWKRNTRCRHTQPASKWWSPDFFRGEKNPVRARNGQAGEVIQSLFCPDTGLAFLLLSVHAALSRGHEKKGTKDRSVFVSNSFLSTVEECQEHDVTPWPMTALHCRRGRATRSRGPAPVCGWERQKAASRSTRQPTERE